MAYLPLILLGLVALFSSTTVLSIVIALRAAREHHNTIFPIIREVEGIKAKRARLVSIVFLILTASTAGAWVATQRNPENILIASVTAELANPTNGQSSSATAATVAVVASGEIRPTTVNVSPPPTGTVVIVVNTTQVVLATPSATPDVVGIPTNTPLSSAPVPAPPAAEAASSTIRAEATTVPSAFEAALTPPPNGARIGPIIFATSITKRREAIDPADTFDSTAEKIYAVFPYQGMKNGVLFSVTWYYQGQEFLRDESEWEWGSTDQSYTFIIPRGIGTYEVELKVGSETMASGNFEIRP